jgi:hypothetical protein
MDIVNAHRLQINKDCIYSKNTGSYKNLGASLIAYPIYPYMSFNSSSAAGTSLLKEVCNCCQTALGKRIETGESTILTVFPTMYFE